MAAKRRRGNQKNLDCETFPKTIAISKNTDDLKSNPSCSHGPTILFDRNGERFFACSAFRTRKLCPFYLKEEDWNNKKRRFRKDSTTTISTLEHKMKKAKSSASEEFVIPQALQVDQGQAQYHFSEESTSFFCQLFQELGFDSVLCVGAPSIHSSLMETHQGNISKLQTHLLDLDSRMENLSSKRSDVKFSQYNMCNHNFFSSYGHDAYWKFLSNSKKIAVFADPPFGAKVEIVWIGLSAIRNDFMSLHSDKSDHQLHFFWIFPYFMEGHIRNHCSLEFQMSDYKIGYRNHAKFKDNPNTSKKNPVRFFTTVNLSEIELKNSGANKKYRYCKKCVKWVAASNNHCKHCATCTTKDGGKSYKHCTACQICVKPSWSHCSSCSKCHLMGSSCRNLPRQKNLDAIKSTEVSDFKSHVEKRSRF